MVGKLFNAADGWIMSFKDDVLGRTTMIPLHPKDINTKDGYNWELSSKEGKEVEFDVVREYSVDGNKVTEYAKLIEEKTETKEPEVRKMVDDDVEKLAEEYTNKRNYLTEEKQGFIDGYNHAKETLYTEEQLRAAMKYASEITNNKMKYMEDYIQSLKQPK